MSSPDSFMFVTCQPGAEQVCKQFLLQTGGLFRLAFSRRGCLTLKLTGETRAALQLVSRNPFALASGWSLGVIKTADDTELARRYWETTQSVEGRQLHAWQAGGPDKPGKDDWPGVSTESERIAGVLAQNYDQQVNGAGRLRVNRPARHGELIHDAIVLSPGEVITGWHEVESNASGWPGGIPPIQKSDTAITRAYYKTTEALLWSRLPMRPGDAVVEIGSAPGGSCQALLEKGAVVIGVDPAEMNERVLSHPQFRHWRMRGAEIKKRELAGVRWLTADSNVAPEHTLDTVESIVAHPSTHIDGLLLTLKMPQWDLAAHLGDYLNRVRGWGFQHLRIRHLAFQRMEVCVFALRHKALLRTDRIKKRKPRPARTGTDALPENTDGD